MKTVFVTGEAESIGGDCERATIGTFEQPIETTVAWYLTNEAWLKTLHKDQELPQSRGLKAA